MAELRADFDQAVLSRFELSPSQQQSLAAMTREEKEAIATTLGLLHTVRSAGRSGTVSVEGLRAEAAVAGAKELELEAEHRRDCTWVFRILGGKSAMRPAALLTLLVIAKWGLMAQEHFHEQPPPGIGSRVGSLAKEMVQTGVVPSVDALARTMLGFRVVTPQGEPVPNAAVYVAVPEVGTLKVEYADSGGRIFLAFSPGLLQRDPIIFGEKDGQLYGVDFSFTWGGKLGESPAPWKGLQNLRLRATEQDGVWYGEGVSEEWVQFGTWILEKGRRFLREFLGWSLLPLVCC